MKRIRLFTMLLLALLVLTGLAVAQEESGPPQVGLRPDAPTYALHGPYWVGTREFVIAPNTERTLRSLVWYPALNPEGVAESIEYPTEAQWLDVPDGVPSITLGHAIRDAAPDMSGGPYPLVICSHCGYGNPEICAALSEHLASYGFVVIAPFHTGEGIDTVQWWQSDVNRAMDVQRVIAYAESLTKEGDLKGLINTDDIGVTGWSSGGYTALVAAGARFDIAWFEEWCADHADVPDCPDVLSHQQDMVDLAKLDSMPEGLWPSWGDSRIKGVVSQSGGTIPFGPEGLAAVTIPVMVQVGSQEADWAGQLVYDYLSNAPKVIAVFEGADHFTFGSTCEDSPWITGTDPSLFWACSDAVWDMDRAQDLINHFATAFLLDTVKGDADAHTALLAENVSFPGITYETTMK